MWFRLHREHLCHQSWVWSWTRAYSSCEGATTRSIRDVVWKRRPQNQRSGSKGQSPVPSNRTAQNVISSLEIGTSVQTWYTLSSRFIYFLKLSSQIKLLTLQIVKIKVQGKCDQTWVVLWCQMLEISLNLSSLLFPLCGDGRNKWVQNNTVGEVL